MGSMLLLAGRKFAQPLVYNEMFLEMSHFLTHTCKNKNFIVKANTDLLTFRVLNYRTPLAITSSAQPK